MHVRVCPDCGEEFRPEIVRCSDCGAELRDSFDDAPPGPPAGAPAGVSAPADDAEYSPIFTTIESEAMRDAAAALAQAGVSFRASGNQTGFQLRVRSEDRPRAAQALGIREGAVLLGPESEAAAGHEGGPCPACGTGLRPGQLECPECRLVLGEEGES
ncbi:MAG TPA: hypothetical protein VMT87_11345 [Vicinamibacteria bacterium]|nr:hypothetical protein [Vicinamibacteria bacterium]